MLVHPVYKNYGYNLESEQIVHLPTNKEVKQRLQSTGYCMCMVSDGVKQRHVLCHRFIWECCNDIIPKGYEVDHVDRNKTNNKIANLRCITLQENRKNRDHTNIIKYAVIAHTLKRFIKATKRNVRILNT